MDEENLVPFDKIKDIISTLPKEKIVRYDGSIGTQSSIIGSPYQVIRLELVYSNGEDGGEAD